MENKIKLLLLLIFGVQFLWAQPSSPYNTSWKADGPIIFATVAAAGYGFYLQNNKKEITHEEITNLNPGSIPSYNRDAIYQYDLNASQMSDIFFAAGIATPFLFALHKPFRKEYKIAVLAFETFAIAGAGYALCAGLVNKYRPFVYNPNAPMGRRTTHLSRNSFYGGHPSMTAAGTFFTAKVIADYYPESNLKYYAYAFATSATLACGYFRYKGGFHFPSDLAIGMGVGTLTGLLVPALHKQKNISVTPVTGQYNGLILQKTF